MTLLAGRPRAISRARLGPDMAAIRPAAAGISDASTSVMRSKVSCSMPLATDSSTASPCIAGATRAAVDRIAAAGTAKMTSSEAALIASGSAVISTSTGMLMSDR